MWRSRFNAQAWFSPNCCLSFSMLLPSFLVLLPSFLHRSLQSCFSQFSPCCCLLFYKLLPIFLQAVLPNFLQAAVLFFSKFAEVVPSVVFVVYGHPWLFAILRDSPGHPLDPSQKWQTRTFRASAHLPSIHHVTNYNAHLLRTFSAHAGTQNFLCTVIVIECPRNAIPPSS